MEGHTLGQLSDLLPIQLNMFPIKSLLGFKNNCCLFFATTRPHAAYAAFTHGLISKWLFIARTIPDVENLFQPLEECIRNIFIPSVTGHLPPGDTERALLALPTQVGGMGIINPIKMCSFEFCASQKVTMPLQSLLLSQMNAS